MNEIGNKFSKAIEAIGLASEQPYSKTLDALLSRNKFLDSLKNEPVIMEVDEKDTFAYKIQQQINKIIEKSNEQNRLLCEQNERLDDNYKKLKELYKLKEKELQEAKRAERKAKIYNVIMLVLAILSMFVAIASWLFPNILGGVINEIQF